MVKWKIFKKMVTLKQRIKDEIKVNRYVMSDAFYKKCDDLNIERMLKEVSDGCPKEFQNELKDYLLYDDSEKNEL